MKLRAKKAWFVLKLLAAVYVGGGILLYFIQDNLLFHPQRLETTHLFNFGQPFAELNIRVADNRNLNLVKFTPQGNRRGIVLYFHGNMKNVERYAKYAPQFTKHQYELWMPDYPGFGKSTGKRTEQAMYADALRIYAMAMKDVKAEEIVIYGKSIGTGVAAYLASVRPCQQLILETPYYSIDALARHYFPIYPVIPLTNYAFPTHLNLTKVKAPVTIFHGTDDEVIPYKQAERLQKENPAIGLITIEKGKHNNLYQFPSVLQKLDSLLSK